MVDKKTVTHVANLAKLELSESEVDQFGRQISEILSYVESLRQIDTQGIEPLITPTEITPFFRSDEVETAHLCESLIKNAPESEGHLYSVPPVV